MTEQFQEPTVDLQSLDASTEADKKFIAEEGATQQQELAVVQERLDTEAKYAAEQADPRNRDQWGAGGVVKELQSAFLGGLQDTASSVVTAPERLIDVATGEMQQESKDNKYTAEWDDWFVNDKNPKQEK